MIKKIDARNQAKAYRSNLGNRDAEYFSLKICNTFMSMEEYREADVLYMYKSVNNEVE